MRNKLRIALAAIQRHQIERPIRVMWMDLQPLGTKGRAKKMRYQFSAIVSSLKDKGYILHDDALHIAKEYGRLSDIIHGRFA